jgi:diguanylate cyclase (GGDEF)-like protein/PAS domain S-box-containing protein
VPRDASRKGVETLRRLHGVLTAIGSGDESDEALTNLARAVADEIGFGGVSVRLARGSELAVVASVGDQAVSFVAPMRSATGQLIGELAVDGTPTDEQRQLLEILAAQLGLALANRQAAHELRQQETVRLAFDHAPVGISVVSLDPGRPGRIAKANEALARMFGYELGDLVGRHVSELLVSGAEAPVLAAAAAGTIETYRSECRCVRADGSLFWALLQAAVLPVPEKGPAQLLCQLVDITARKESERELAHRAAHDPLTGLVNRTTVCDRLEEVIASSRHEDHPGAVLFCDLDQFKVVNDTHGHLIGDEVLATVARRIAATVRRSDTVGRYGGDEFLVVVPDISFGEAQEMADRLVRAIDEPIVVGGATCRVGASVGVVVLSGAASANEVLAQADEAMYGAKRVGEERYLVRHLRKSQ